jgi:hypothetical protein
MEDIIQQLADNGMTKSNANRGGKRKGAGRPVGAGGGKSEYFSTRLTPQTRQLLEAEASRRGETISKTAEDLLMMALEEGLSRPRPINALLPLIGNLGDKFEEWNTNPYWFVVFRTAVVTFIDYLRPPGEAVKPEDEDDLPDAESYGYWEARDMIQEAKRLAKLDKPPEHLVRRMPQRWPRYHYNMVDAFKYLIKPKDDKLGS